MNLTDPDCVIGSTLRRNKNKRINQLIRKKSNKIQYASKHVIYANENKHPQRYSKMNAIFKRKQPIKQRRDRKKFKAQRRRKKVMKCMAFDYQDFVYHDQHRSHPETRKLGIAHPTIPYDALNGDSIERLYNSYYDISRYNHHKDCLCYICDASESSKIKNKNNINADLMHENDRTSRLICGYSPYELPPDVRQIIGKYAWYHNSEYSLHCIAVTHWLAQYIDKFMNGEEDRCPYSNNDDINILSYIYVRGEALRDCYLFREISEINLVIDVDGLSKKFLDHLSKYHSTTEQQGNCKCIYWRFHQATEDINNAEYLLNAEFISQVVCQSKYVERDCFPRYMSMAMKRVLSAYFILPTKIRICRKGPPVRFQIDDGILNLNYFTINCSHIDLQSVLTHSENGGNCIDYHWENKMMRKYRYDIINELNKMAVEDLKAKVIRTPFIGKLNVEHPKLYFWRFVKLTQKFIDKIIAGLWHIDDKTMETVQSLYGKWFNEETFLKDTDEAERNRREFVKKFMKWEIYCDEDVVRRFKVFRYIGFEKHFINLLNRSRGLFLLDAMQNNLDPMRGDEVEYAEVFRICLRDFGYF